MFLHWQRQGCHKHVFESCFHLHKLHCMYSSFQMLRKLHRLWKVNKKIRLWPSIVSLSSKQTPLHPVTEYKCIKMIVTRIIFVLISALYKYKHGHLQKKDFIQLMYEEWQTSLFIQPRQVISDEAVGRVRYYLGEAE